MSGQNNITNETEWIDFVVNSARKGELMVLCGAGISIDSGLPVVNDFLEVILSALGFNGVEVQSILLKVPTAIPFERFVEVVVSSSPSMGFLSLFRNGKPNVNHRALAMLAAEGYLRTIVTTNFDHLIENALRNHEKKIDFVVYDDPKKFSTIDSADDRVQVIKLHGSAGPLNSMAVTLSGIMKDSNRQAVIALSSRLMAEWPERSVLVTGYSCSDKFDISPGIAMAGGEGGRRPTILQLEHLQSSREGVNPGEIQSVVVSPWSDKIQDYPFADYLGNRLFADTSDVLRRIAERSCGLTMAEEEEATGESGKSDDIDWRTEINKWAEMMENEFPGIACIFVSGAIHELAEAWDAAYCCYDTSLQAACCQGNSVWKVRCQNSLGNIHLARGELTEAVNMFRQSLKICREIENHFGVQECLLNISNVYRQWCDLLLTNAISMNTKAIKVIDEHSEGKWPLGIKAAHHAAMGTLYGRLWEFVEAIKNYEVASQEFKAAGELRQELSVISNWASALFAMEKYGPALELYEKAIKLAQDCGDNMTAGQLMINRGNVFVRLKQWKKALDVYHVAETALIPIVGSEHGLIAQIANFRRQVQARMQVM